MEVLGVKESVVQHLRKKIIVGELAPGQKLNEAQLASHLQVSRPPLREAFRVLEHEHLVVSHPRKGAYVSPLSTNDLEEIFKARVMIECYAIDLLKERKIRELPEIEKAIQATMMLTSPSYENTEDVLRYLETVIAFHRKLIESTGNHWIQRFYQSIHPSLTRYEFIYTYLPDRAGPWRSEHKKILSLIEAAQYERAKALLTTHIRRVVDVLKKKIATGSPSLSPVAKPGGGP